MKQWFLPLAVMMAFLCLIGLPTPVSCADGRLEVFVSIQPQRCFVEKIGGERVEVHVMVSPGANPATYEPKPNQMVALADASAYFAVGVPFEDAWLERIASMNTGMHIVHTDKGIEKRVMETRPLQGESAQSAHSHEGTKDPHVWLSPPLVMLQARHVLETLIDLEPSRRTFFEGNYKAFIMELVDLDADIRGVFAGVGGNNEFLVFHPSWGYFAEAYGLKQIPVETEGKEPKPAELAGLIQYAEKQGIKAVFVQPQFSRRSASVIANAIGGEVITADPLAAAWDRNLREVAASLRKALK